MSDGAMVMLQRACPAQGGTGKSWRVMPQSASTSGFTLIELMIAVAIVAIIAAIALPSYNQYIIKTNRRAAEGCLSQYANYMERYYTTNMRYDKDTAGTANTLPVLDCAGTNQTGGRYGYSLPSAPTANTYVVQALPKGAQLSGDTLCGTLKLDNLGTRTISGTGSLAQCW